jgi:hypothetical protein
VPFPQLRVLGLLAHDRVLHDGIAEVIHYRRDGENAAQSLIQTFLRHDCSLLLILSSLFVDRPLFIVALHEPVRFSLRMQPKTIAISGSTGRR